MSTEPAPQDQPTPTCCGKGRPAGWNGDPKESSALRQACQLCPDSATYWDPTGEKKAALAEV